jgi:hypothetical protein
LSLRLSCSGLSGCVVQPKPPRTGDCIRW